ncbi:MAG: CRISPR-associated endonuclease Cas2 [Deltaproteobacteria bacterium]|nr:MAG: CRISPR-associated endonuclease Cas2 [Deltaproteobacteria bacterium]
MGSKRRPYQIAYDVRDPKRLWRVARILEGYGVRVQYRLFRCRLGRRVVERLRWELSRVFHPEDSLLVIGLCPGCVRYFQERNPTLPEESDATFEII